MRTLALRNLLRASSLIIQMTEPSCSSNPGAAPKPFEWLSVKLGWILLLLAGAGLLAITNRSLWIDESVTAQFAKEPTLADCWKAMRHFPEIQLPLYMVFMWAYVHVFGFGEWTLRVAGLSWFIFGATIFVRASE